MDVDYVELSQELPVLGPVEVFVNPSAGIPAVGIQAIRKDPFWTSWRSQKWWISMSRSFV
jgi:hypothetical protein